MCVTSHTLYSYGFTGLSIPQTFDIGLLILDEPVYLDEYASLAEAGSLDQLATRRGLQDITFTVTGYGVSGVKPLALSPISPHGNRESRQPEKHLAKGFNIQLTGNHGGGKAGTCFGDSGGPILYDSTDIGRRGQLLRDEPAMRRDVFRLSRRPAGSSRLDRRSRQG